VEAGKRFILTREKQRVQTAELNSLINTLYNAANLGPPSKERSGNKGSDTYQR